MKIFLTIIFLAVCVALAVIVLMQEGKSAGLGSIGGIGDSWNDLPMINNVDESFTFPYAPDDVQEQSDHIVKHLDEAISYLISE